VEVSAGIPVSATENDAFVDRYTPLFDGDRGLAALWVAAKLFEDETARAELVVIYGPLVRYVVSRLNITLAPSMERGDLLGFGTIGLIDAIARFDMDRGFTFQTYGVTRIKGAILDELRAGDWVPRSIRRTMHDIDRARGRFEQERGSEPSIGDIVAATGLATAEVRSTMLACRNGQLSPLDDGADQLIDSTSNPPEEAYAIEESRRELRASIGGLRPRQRAVVALYYFEEMTFAEIGRVLGVSESRACQVHGRALKELRQASTTYDDGCD